MLDPRMIYSCAYWHGAERTATTLAEAQEAKLTLIANKLQLEPACACSTSGAAGVRRPVFAERYGCTMVGVTVSKEQAALARERCAGLPVEVRLTDYRELDEPFDRVYSIGCSSTSA